MIVYTAAFNSYDQLCPPPAAPDGTQFVYYTDRTTSGPKGWEKRRVACQMEPERCALYCKILSTVYFPGEVTVWSGENVVLRGDLGALAGLVVDSDIAVLRNPERDCLYAEAESCLHRHIDSPDVIRNQVARYRREHYPEHRGLSATFLIVRRDTPRIRRLEEAWWQEVDQGSVRDQLSFDYCCWKQGVQPATIPGDIFAGPFHTREGLRG